MPLPLTARAWRWPKLRRSYCFATWKRAKSLCCQPADVREDYRSVAFDPQGRYLAASDTSPSKVDLWDLQTKQRLFLRDADGMHVASSPDGETLASADYVIQLWEVPSGKLKAEFHFRSETLLGQSAWASSITSLAFSPDGNTLVAGGLSGKLMRWDVGALGDGK